MINLQKIHKETTDTDNLLLAEECKCFHCFSRFSPKDIDTTNISNDYIPCPNCNIDAVIYSDVSEEDLLQLHNFYF